MTAVGSKADLILSGSDVGSYLNIGHSIGEEVFVGKLVGGDNGCVEPMSCRDVRKTRAEAAAYADCTEAQMMAMFGWTDPKMPAHYIAKAKRDKLGLSGMEKLVSFDRSQNKNIDDFLPSPAVNATVTPISNFRKKVNDFKVKRGRMVRSEGGEDASNFKGLVPWVRNRVQFAHKCAF